MQKWGMNQLTVGELLWWDAMCDDFGTLVQHGRYGDQRADCEEVSSGTIQCTSQRTKLPTGTVEDVVRVGRIL